ncbi:MAG: acyl carrier protein [Acidobacteriota bacterium]
MTVERDAAKAQIRAKVVDLATTQGVDASGLTDDEIIPATGLRDSMAILERLVWYEDEFKLSMRPEEINIDNLGSIDAMTNYLIADRTS